RCQIWTDCRTKSGGASTRISAHAWRDRTCTWRCLIRLAGMRSQSSEAWLMTWPTFIRKFALVYCNGVGARKKTPHGRGDSDLRPTGRSMRPALCVLCKPSYSATSSLRHAPLPRGLTSAELAKRSGDGAGLRPALLLDSLAS